MSNASTDLILRKLHHDFARTLASMEIFDCIGYLFHAVEWLGINFDLQLARLIQLDQLRHLARNLADEVQQEHGSQGCRFAE